MPGPAYRVFNRVSENAGFILKHQCALTVALHPHMLASLEPPVRLGPRWGPVVAVMVAVMVAMVSPTVLQKQLQFLLRLHLL